MPIYGGKDKDVLMLTVNMGSSSIKAALYQTPHEDRRSGTDPERVDSLTANLALEAKAGTEHQLAPLFDWLSNRQPDAVGHRVVHGGQAYREPIRISGTVVEDLRRLVPIDPDHLPQALDAIEATGSRFPSAPQVACFDTAFHRHMPRVAQMYPLPRDLAEAGVIRYGFHGLSCEYIMDRLATLDPRAEAGRVIIAHLGNGSSMTGVQAGASVDTTIGFTPTGGLVMGTRSGDLDPGVLVYLVKEQGFGGEALSRLVNHQAGLLAVSELSADMRELVEQEAGDYRAEEAIQLYCYQARKFIGALAATMGGLDTLAFTGGIGENAVQVRKSICSGLEFLGISIEDRMNEKSASVISPPGGVTVRVMATDEDLVVARHTYRLLS